MDRGIRGGKYVELVVELDALLGEHAPELGAGSEAREHGDALVLELQHHVRRIAANDALHLCGKKRKSTGTIMKYILIKT